MWLLAGGRSSSPCRRAHNVATGFAQKRCSSGEGGGKKEEEQEGKGEEQKTEREEKREGRGSARDPGATDFH